MAIKRVSSSRLSERVAALTAIHNEKVYIGHFSENGIHEDSGMTYAELMALHHVGGDMGVGLPVPPRPLLDFLFMHNIQLKDKGIRSAIDTWLKKGPTEDSNKQLLDNIGKIIGRKEIAMFGQSPPFAPNSIRHPKGRNEPLVDEGDLRSATSYLNTITGVIRKVK